MELTRVPLSIILNEQDQLAGPGGWCSGGEEPGGSRWLGGVYYGGGGVLQGDFFFFGSLGVLYAFLLSLVLPDGENVYTICSIGS